MIDIVMDAGVLWHPLVVIKFDNGTPGNLLDAEISLLVFIPSEVL